MTDMQHACFDLTKPQRRMLGNLLMHERGNRPPVYPWGGDWKVINHLKVLELVEMHRTRFSVNGDGGGFHHRAVLTDKGREWAGFVVNAGWHL